jgi:DNA mismatch repair protein MutS
VHILPGTKEAQGGFEQPFIREEFLRKTIQIRTLLPIRESLGLSEKSERILCATLQRIEELFPSGATKFYPPTKWSPNSSLFLGNQALVQLNMITPREEDSVLGLFLGTQTAFGKRAMRNRLLYPLADPTKLEESYNEIEVFNEKKMEFLKQIGDLPRLHRRLMQGDFNAQDVLTLDQSYTRAAQIAESLSDTVLSYRVANIQKLHDEFLKLFSVEKALKASDTRFCFQTGVAPNVDAIEAQIEVHSNTLDTILLRLKEWAQADLRYDFKETMSPTIIGTKASMALLKRGMDSGKHPYKMEIVSKKSSHLEVAEVATAWFAIQKQKVALQDAIRVALLPLCSALAREISPLWDELETWLAKVDVSYTLWKRSKEYGFVRPILVPSKESAISIEGLRHPLIERQATRTEYVKHSVELDTNRGWLVYGMNASGKSSLMKAVGIAVLLAQAGCFVPATTFRFTPFQSLFTRILNTDILLWSI